MGIVFRHGIPVRNNINPAIFSGRCHPINIITHGYQQVSNQILKPIWVYRFQDGLDLFPCQVLHFFNCKTKLRHFRYLISIESIFWYTALFPPVKEPASLLIELFGIGIFMISLLPFLSDKPATFILYQPTSFYQINCSKTDYLYEALRIRRGWIIAAFLFS